MKIAHWLQRSALGILLILAGPSLASEPTHGAVDPAAEHAAEHGSVDHGGHHYYTSDDDGDGVPNWADPTNGFQENTETYVLEGLAWHILNLAILIGLVGWAARKPIIDVFRDRERKIRGELTDSAHRRDEANQRHQEIVSRLDEIEGEVTAMQNKATADAVRDEQKLIERAEREAVRIAEQAGRAVRDETTRARQALRREAVELAVSLAEETLRSNVASADQRSLATDFLASLDQPGEA